MGRVKLQIKKIENTTNSIEDILARYVNLPEHERGRLHNQEYLQKALGKLKSEADKPNQAISPISVDSQVEEIQQEVMRCKSQLDEMGKQLRVYEGDPWEIDTVCEAEYREEILEETLRQVRARKANLPQQATHVNGYDTRNASNILDWIPQRDHDQIPILNFLDPTRLLPLRDHQKGERIENMLAPAPLTLPHTPADMHLNDDNSPNSRIEDDPQLQRPEFGQIIDVNLLPWIQLYPTGNDPFPVGQPREGALLELFLSQLAPVNHDNIDI